MCYRVEDKNQILTESHLIKKKHDGGKIFSRILNLETV